MTAIPTADRGRLGPYESSTCQECSQPIVKRYVCRMHEDIDTHEQTDVLTTYGRWDHVVNRRSECPTERKQA